MSLYNIESLFVEGSYLLEKAELNDAFWKWFGNSKIVDAKGNPLEVYHGSTTKFSVFKTNNEFMLDRMVGFHFAKDEKIAKTFAKKEDDIYKVYLKMEKPLDLTSIKTGFDQNNISRLIISMASKDPEFNKLFLTWFEYAFGHWDNYKKMLSELSSRGYITRDKKQYDPVAFLENFDVGLHMNGEVIKPWMIKLFLAQCQREGYDGIIYNNTSPMETMNATDKICYVIFSPNNIKSVDNSGEWKTSSDNIYEKSNINSAFWKWFGKSKAVDSKGKPLVLYHGTTSEFDAFDLGKADPESNLGSGFYFSNNALDSAKNYTINGKDLEQKIQQEVERLASEQDKDYDDPELIALVKSKYIKNEGNIIPVYLSIQNPVYIGGPKETFLSYEMEYDEEEEKFTGKESGELVAFIDLFKQNVFEISNKYIEEALGKIFEKVYDYNGISVSDLFSILKEYDQNFEDFDTGVLGSKNYIKQTFIDMGYDGIIDSTVSKKFGSQSGRQTKMVGVNKNTKHYIVFSPTQIKSIYNKGTWNPKSAKIQEQY